MRVDNRQSDKHNAGMSDQSRRYTDSEVLKIIEKALALQRGEGQAAPPGEREGSSIRDIDAVAAEVGISTELIRRAAAELDLEGEGKRPNRFLGGVITPEQVSVARGLASRDTLDRIFMLIPSLVGDTGSGSVVADTLLWSSDADAVARTGHSVHVSVTSSENGSIVRVQDRLAQMAGGVFGGVMGGVGLGGGLGVGLSVGLAVLESVPFAVLFPVGVLAGSYLLSRFIFSVFSRSRRRRIREIAENIRDCIDRGNK